MCLSCVLMSEYRDVIEGCYADDCGSELVCARMGWGMQEWGRGKEGKRALKSSLPCLSEGSAGSVGFIRLPQYPLWIYPFSVWNKFVWKVRGVYYRLFGALFEVVFTGRVSWSFSFEFLVFFFFLFLQYNKAKAWENNTKQRVVMYFLRAHILL